MTIAETEIARMQGTSLDIGEQRRKELKQLFPGAFTETRNDKGELVETIDFERLKAELGQFSEVYDNRRERYGMDWPGKRDCLRLIQQPSSATLKPCREESVDFDITENLFIEGDNLEVLKLLQKSYYGQVKMIYIDPPYNTGNEFIYPDNYAESLNTYLEYAGMKDSEGRIFSTNTANEGRFHTRWLNMMYPRLYLARNLLREDGVIFISIDDNEVENLRRICDEIFGEENLLAVITWKRRQVPDNRNQNGVSTDHEYVVAYKKQTGKFKGKEKDLSKYENHDNDPRGPWMSDNLTGLASRDQRPNLHYDIIRPDTGQSYPPHPGRGWAYEKSRMESLINEGRILWPKSDSGRPRLKRFLADLKESTTGFSTVQAPGYTTDGTREVTSLLGFKAFDFPKPSSLISLLIDQVTDPNTDCIVLDFFAGSCTTASAVLKKNLSDGGGRRFIQVQLPELCDANSEANARGYRTIADIGKERIRNTIGGIRSGNENQLDYGQLDLGLKVLKLDQSNFKPWQSVAPDISDEALIQQMELNVDHVNPNASQEDLLYELLLKAGLKPTESIEQIELANRPVYSVAEGALLVYLGDQMNQAMIDAILDQAPSQFICLDKAFHGNDQLKANAAKTFENFNRDKEGLDRIEFRTV